jgi:hypothetical protein
VGQKKSIEVGGKFYIKNKRKVYTMTMINLIEMAINNGRTMQLAQQGKEENITLTTYNDKSGLVDFETQITPGDMVMLINYYRYQKDKSNNEKENKVENYLNWLDTEIEIVNKEIQRNCDNLQKDILLKLTKSNIIELIREDNIRLQVFKQVKQMYELFNNII